MTFTQKETLPKIAVCVLIRGYTVTGDLQYIYLATTADRLLKLKEAVSSESYTVQDYGNVLAWGVGDPPPDVMQRMHEEYGFDHENGMVLEPLAPGAKSDASE